MATIMFADISGFTARSEKIDPKKVAMLMSDKETQVY
jgi:class 3 adenylate cyclase